jgi:hypothetical protein
MPRFLPKVTAVLRDRTIRGPKPQPRATAGEASMEKTPRKWSCRGVDRVLCEAELDLGGLGMHAAEWVKRKKGRGPLLRCTMSPV